MDTQISYQSHVLGIAFLVFIFHIISNVLFIWTNSHWKDLKWFMNNLFLLLHFPQ